MALCPGLIGCCGHGQWPDRERIEFELDLDISILRLLCDQEPRGTTLEIIWHEHDSGQYAEICLGWEQGSLDDREWEYITRCERALTDLNESVDWAALWEARLRLQAEPSSLDDVVDSEDDPT
jgi:hypothetical protein